MDLLIYVILTCAMIAFFSEYFSSYKKDKKFLIFLAISFIIQILMFCAYEYNSTISVKTLSNVIEYKDIKFDKSTDIEITTYHTPKWSVFHSTESFKQIERRN